MSNNKIKIMISTWYDTVTPESAECGDFESTGNECRTYYPDTLTEAAQWFKEKYDTQHWDDQPTVNAVLYASDPDRDFTDGSESYDRLVLTVDSDQAVKCDRQKRIERALNYLINK